jgi:hypothetical protein
MDIRHIARTASVVLVAALLLTFAFAVAPKAAQPAYAATATATKAAAAAPASAAAAPAEAAPAEAAKTEAAAGGEKKAEIPHVVGHPSPSQLADLRRSWDSIPGYDLLFLAILGLLATVGIVVFGAYKQMKI